MFYLYLFVILCELVALFLTVLLIFPWLAKRNLFFTTVKEGTVKAIKRGKTLDRFIMSFAGYHLNDPAKPWYRSKNGEWEVLNHGEDNPNGFTGDQTKDSYYDDRLWILRYLGLYWVGWPWANSVYNYKFAWNETRTESKTGGEEIFPRDEWTDFAFVSDFVYAIKTVSAETKDRLPTDELTLVTVAIRNPYRALFRGEDWMRRITSAVNRRVRTFVANKDFQELILGQKESQGKGNSTETGDTRDFSAPIILLNKKLTDDVEGSPLPHGLVDRYGVEIRTADLQSVELSGEAKERDLKATTEQYVAEQQAKAIRLTGNAEADVIKLKGDTEAEALRARLAVIREHGEAGVALAGFDAVQESSKGPGNTIIWANNPLNVIAGLLPKKTEAEGDKG
ncbi:hypothetical protein HKL94_01580 [Candidatus Parcubacteria bacterium]|nr:hypothetical protein [Candidatus Parcubacteria bacterium]